MIYGWSSPRATSTARSELTRAVRWSSAVRASISLLGSMAARSFELGRHCARGLEVGFRRTHQLARGFELCRQRRRFERRRFKTLFEIGALAGEIAEPAANHGGLAHDVGQIVLAFFAAALGMLEFVVGDCRA